MYISLFKSEIGSKLRPRSMFQPPLFTYRYGHSFILFVIGCISAEIVGTLNFFLFIQIREIGREKVSHPFMNGMGLIFVMDTCMAYIFNCTVRINRRFKLSRQFRASCTPAHQKTRQTKNELIPLDRNSKRRRLLNVKSIRQFQKRFSRPIHSVGKCCSFFFHVGNFIISPVCVLYSN